MMTIFQRIALNEGPASPGNKACGNDIQTQLKYAMKNAKATS